MDNINNRLSKIDDTLFEMNIGIKRIDESVKRINTMLDELIAALHNYDDGLEMFNDEPQRGSCSKHDEASWEMETELNERMDVIGQNGNEGLHYESMEELNDEMFGKIVDDGFDDYGKRIEKKGGLVSISDGGTGQQATQRDGYTIYQSSGEKDNNNNPAKRTGGNKVLGEWQVNNKNKQVVVGDKDKRKNKYYKTDKSKKDSTKYITNHKLGLGNKLG